MLILRNDDVNAGTNFIQLADMYEIIKKWFPGCCIWSCVTLMCEPNKEGSVYNDIPFKHKKNDFYFKAKTFMYGAKYVIGDVIASHGLYHFDHTKVHDDLAESSILSSCVYLNVNKFVAPFNAVNQHIKNVCDANGIELSTIEYDWKSLEFNDFDPEHQYWYFHSWRWSPESLREKLSGHCANVGQL